MDFNEQALIIFEAAKKELEDVEVVLSEKNKEIDKEWLNKMNIKLSSISDNVFYEGAETVGDVIRFAKQERKQVLEKLSNCLDNESEKQMKLTARLFELNKLISAQERAEEEKETEKYKNAQTMKSAVINSMLEQLIDKVEEEIKALKNEIIEFSSKIAETVGKEDLEKYTEVIKNSNKKIIEYKDLKESLNTLKSYDGTVYSNEFVFDLSSNLTKEHADLVNGCYGLITKNSVNMKKKKEENPHPDDKTQEKINEINRLLDKAEKDLDKKALEEARKLIENLPNGHEKEELTKRLNAISDKIIEKEITDLLDKAEKDLDKSALDKAKDLISKLPNGDKKRAFEKRADEIDKLIKEKDGKDPNGGSDSDDKDDPKPEQPTIEENAPKKTWKTYVSLAAGIGVGAAVFFTCGTVGVSVMAIAGGITKRLLAKRRRKLELQRLKGELPIEEVEEPLPGIKGKIQKLKNYFKSEEFCRDANWFLNGAIYTGLGLNIASSIYNLASAKFGAGVDTTPTPDTVTTGVQPKLDPTTATNPDPMSGIKIGENVGDYNVSVGHDTASWATSGSHTENLISEYVNSGSIFKRFAVMNPDGTVGQMINTNGLSIADFCNQSGIDPSQIAVDVASKNGTSQAWVSVSELVKGVGGKSL